MADDKKTIKVLLYILIALVVIGGILLLIFQPWKSETPPLPDGSPAPGDGIGEAFGAAISNFFGGNLFGNLFSGGKCDPEHPGFTNNGKRNLKCDSEYSQTMCDSSKPGYNKNGIKDPSCGGGSGSCNPFECDPAKPGHNMCGDKGFPCN